jgi:hypothetical protein
VIEGANNRLIDCEDLTEAELQTLHTHYAKLVAFAKKDGSLTTSHSLAEAEERHKKKRDSR